MARYEYEPFGLTARTEGTLGGRDVHKFTGKPEDAGTGLYYFNARYYDPELGRFISQDPLGEGPNPYGYCFQNPLRYVDPTGCYAVLEEDEYGRPLITADHGGTQRDDDLGWDALADLEEANVVTSSQSLQPGVFRYWESHLETQRINLDLGLLATMAGAVIVHDSGKPHGSPEHWARIVSLVASLKASGQAVEIWVNKSISTITEGVIKCLWRPDVAWKDPKGLLKVLEQQSRTQALEALQYKVSKMLELLGKLAGEGEVKPWK